MPNYVETKLFELRDSMTFIPIMATRLASDHEQEQYLLRRAGYSEDPPYSIVLTNLNTGESRNNVYDWPAGVRTHRDAHQHIVEHWNELTTGQVIDIEHILGITAAPKQSARFETV